MARFVWTSPHPSPPSLCLLPVSSLRCEQPGDGLQSSSSSLRSKPMAKAAPITTANVDDTGPSALGEHHLHPLRAARSVPPPWMESLSQVSKTADCGVTLIFSRLVLSDIRRGGACLCVREAGVKSSCSISVSSPLVYISVHFVSTLFTRLR